MTSVGFVGCILVRSLDDVGEVLGLYVGGVLG